MKHYKPWYKKVVEATKKIKFNRWPLYWKSLMFSAGAALGISAIVVGATRVNDTSARVNYNLSSGVNVSLRVELPEDANDNQEINYALDQQTAINITGNYLSYLQAMEPDAIPDARIDPTSVQANDNTISFTIGDVTTQEINSLSNSANNNESFSSLFQHSLLGFGNGQGSLFTDNNTLSASADSSYYGANIITANSFSGSVDTPASGDDQPDRSTINFNVSNADAWNSMIELAAANTGNGDIALYFARVAAADSSSATPDNLFRARAISGSGIPTVTVSDQDFNGEGELSNIGVLGNSLRAGETNQPVLLSIGRFQAPSEGEPSTSIRMVTNTASQQTLLQTLAVLNASSLSDRVSLVSMVNTPAIFTVGSGNGFIIGGVIVLSILVLILLFRYALLGLIGTVLLASFSMASFLISNVFISSGGITDTNQYSFVGIFAFIFMLLFVFSRLFIFFEGVKKEYLLTKDFRKSLENALKFNIWKAFDLHVILFIFSVVLFLTTLSGTTPVREFTVVIFAGTIASFGVQFILLPFLLLPLSVNSLMNKTAKYWSFSYAKWFKNKFQKKGTNKNKEHKVVRQKWAIKIKNMWYVFIVPVAAIIALIVSLTAGVNTQSDFQPGAQIVIYDNEQSSSFVQAPINDNESGRIQSDGRTAIDIVNEVLTNNTVYRVTGVEVGTFFLEDTLANSGDIFGLKRDALIFTTNIPDILSTDRNIEGTIRSTIANNAGRFSIPPGDIMVSNATVILPGTGSMAAIELARAFGIFFGFLALFVIIRYRKSQLLVITLSLIGSFGLIISLLLIFQIPLLLLVVVGFMMVALFLLITQFSLYSTFNEKIKLLKKKNEVLTKQTIKQLVNETYKDNLGWLIIFSVSMIIIMISVLIPLAIITASIAGPLIIALFIGVLLPVIWSMPLLISFEAYWLYKTKQINKNVEQKGRKIDEHTFKGINS